MSNTPGRSTVIISTEVIRPSSPCRRMPSITRRLNLGFTLISENVGPIRQAICTALSDRPSTGNVQKLAQFMQAGLKDVADAEGVIAFAFGAQAVFQHFGRVLKFQIAVLVRHGAMRGKAKDINRRAGGRRIGDQPLQNLPIAARSSTRATCRVSDRTGAWSSPRLYNPIASVRHKAVSRQAIPRLHLCSSRQIASLPFGYRIATTSP